MKESIILPVKLFIFYALSIFQYGHFSFAIYYVSTCLQNDNTNVSKYFDNLFQDKPPIEDIKLFDMIFLNQFFWSISSSYILLYCILINTSETILLLLDSILDCKYGNIFSKECMQLISLQIVFTPILLYAVTLVANCF